MRDCRLFFVELSAALLCVAGVFWRCQSTERIGTQPPWELRTQKNKTSKTETEKDGRLLCVSDMLRVHDWELFLFHPSSISSIFLLQQRRFSTRLSEQKIHISLQCADSSQSSTVSLLNTFTEKSSTVHMWKTYEGAFHHVTPWNGAWRHVNNIWSREQ